MREKETEGICQRLLARMRTDKRFEATVYLVLLLLAAVAYTLTIKAPAARMDSAAASREDAVALQLEEALSSMQGVGEAKVMITREEKDDTVRGVIVIAQGTEDFAVKLRIQNAVCTVLDVGNDRVEVFEMRENKKEE